MSIDMSDELVDALKREVSPPGTDLYPNATDAEWLNRLRDAFWEGRLNGLFGGYSVDDDGVVSPVSGSTDLSREMQQAIVLYAGYRTTLTQFQNISSAVRSKAGPVEFEIERSAALLRDILKDVRDRLSRVLQLLSTLGMNNATVFDAVIERSYSTAYRDTWWVR